MKINSNIAEKRKKEREIKLKLQMRDNLLKRKEQKRKKNLDILKATKI